jgi:hypothetical protein
MHFMLFGKLSIHLMAWYSLLYIVLSWFTWRASVSAIQRMVVGTFALNEKTVNLVANTRRNLLVLFSCFHKY